MPPEGGTLRTLGARRLAVLVTIVLGAGVLSAVTTTPSVAAPDDGTFTTLRGFEPSGAKVRVEPKRLRRRRASTSPRCEARPARPAAPPRSSTIPRPVGSPRQTFRVAAHPADGVGARCRAPRDRDLVRSRRRRPAAPPSPSTSPRWASTPPCARPAARATWYVDPAYNRRGTTAHLSYYATPTCRAPSERRAEGEVATSATSVDAKARADRRPRPARRSRASVYRLALTSDPSYAAYFGTDNVLAEKVTLINRVNQIYNDDLAIRAAPGQRHRRAQPRHRRQGDRAERPVRRGALLPPRRHRHARRRRRRPAGDLDFCDGPTLGQNRIVIGLLVGARNFDIGHIALGVNGGGVASLGVVGGNNKAQGCTGVPTPVGDLFAVDYVAHEMGHQFAGNHTFNGTQSNCSGGNRNAATSVEPGSGSSIMAYAGICTTDDLQPHSDPYFSFSTRSTRSTPTPRRPPTPTSRSRRSR